MDVLDCRHARVRRGMAYGTAHTPDGRTICLSCAGREEGTAFMADTRERQASDGPFFAYLSMDGRWLTTWTGMRLARVTSLWRTSSGFGGRMPSGGRNYFRAVDLAGRRWYGNTPGRGMYARARLAKPRA